MFCTLQRIALNLQYNLVMLHDLIHYMILFSQGVIFQTNKDGSLPPHVMYKIRQNSSFTEKTNEIRRAYWRPGPNTGGKFYFLYGFVWIQGKGSKCMIPVCRYMGIYRYLLLDTWICFFVWFTGQCRRTPVVDTLLVWSTDDNSLCYKGC